MGLRLLGWWWWWGGIANVMCWAMGDMVMVLVLDVGELSLYR